MDRLDHVHRIVRREGNSPGSADGLRCRAWLNGFDDQARDSSFQSIEISSAGTNQEDVLLFAVVEGITGIRRGNVEEVHAVRRGKCGGFKRAS